MSVRSRRFDKYIPLFGKADDRRVALFLGELEDQAINNKNKEPTRKAYKLEDVVLTAQPPAFQNRYFNNMDTTVNDDATHPDWIEFISDLIARLNDKIVSTTPKITPEDSKLLTIAKSLNNASDGSIEQFILIVLSKIATFGVGSGDRSFFNNFTQLATMDKIKYFPALDILNGKAPAPATAEKSLMLGPVLESLKLGGAGAAATAASVLAGFKEWSKIDLKPVDINLMNTINALANFQTLQFNGVNLFKDNAFSFDNDKGIGLALGTHLIYTSIYNDVIIKYIQKAIERAKQAETIKLGGLGPGLPQTTTYANSSYDPAYGVTDGLVPANNSDITAVTTARKTVEAALKKDMEEYIQNLQAQSTRSPYTAAFNKYVDEKVKNNGQLNNEDNYLKFMLDFIKTIDTKTEFQYKYDKYWLNQILSEAMESPISIEKPSDFLMDGEVSVDAGKYWRKVDGSLWTVDATGKELQVDIKSKAYNDLTVANKCLGTGFEDKEYKGNQYGCADYLRECLAGGNVIKCKAYLENPNFWNSAEAEVAKMLPGIALTTLKSFEFEDVDTWDETNKTNLRKVFEVTDWLAKLAAMTKETPSQLTPEEYNNIARNDKLTGYLGMLVKKINSNPAILNKGVVKSDEQLLYRDNAFKGTKLAKMGLLPRVFASNLAPSSVERLGNLLKSEQNSFRLRLNPGLLFGRILSGGGTPLEEIEDKLSSENKQVWSLLKTHYQGLRYQLKKHKKEIAKVDVEKIEELFNQLQKAEVKLMKVIVMTEKYKRLLEIHGEQDASTVLRIEHIKRFVDERNRYFDRVVKKQDVLLDIIKSIALQVQKDAPTQVSSAVASVASETRKFKGAPLKIDDLLG
jgi:hypothetical protein